METMGAATGEVVTAGMNQRQRCNTLTLPLAKIINAGLKKGQSLQPFANGTRFDPTVGSSSNLMAALTKRNSTTKGNSTGTASLPTFTGAASPSRRWTSELLGVAVMSTVLLVGSI
jgi:hypothetical protein